MQINLNPLNPVTTYHTT